MPRDVVPEAGLVPPGCGGNAPGVAACAQEAREPGEVGEQHAAPRHQHLEGDGRARVGGGHLGQCQVRAGHPLTFTGRPSLVHRQDSRVWRFGVQGSGSCCATPVCCLTAHLWRSENPGPRSLGHPAGMDMDEARLLCATHSVKRFQPALGGECTLWQSRAWPCAGGVPGSAARASWRCGRRSWR